MTGVGGAKAKGAGPTSLQSRAEHLLALEEAGFFVDDEQTNTVLRGFTLEGDGGVFAGSQYLPSHSHIRQSKAAIFGSTFFLSVTKKKIIQVFL